MAVKKTWSNTIKPDHDREVFTVLRMVRESGKTDTEICRQAGISPQTLKNWRKGYLNGGTRYPSGINLSLVAQAAGYMKVWVPNGTQSLTNVVPFPDEEPSSGKRRTRSTSRRNGTTTIQVPTSARRKKAARQSVAIAV